MARLLRQGPFFSLLPYSFGFIYIALDEIGQIHETVPERLAEVFPIAVTNYQEFLFSIGFSSAYWLLFYLPFLVVAPFYLLYIAKQYVHTRVPLWQCAFFLIGAFLLVGVPVIEFINMRPQIWASDDFFVWTLIEEYTEMVAGTFFLAFHALILSGQMRALQKKL